VVKRNDMETTFERVPEFVKDLTDLSQTYRLIQEDFGTYENLLRKMSFDRLKSNDKIVQIRPSQYNIDEKIPVWKAKRFYSSDLKGRGGDSNFRVIFSRDVKQIVKILFIEIYFHRAQKDLNVERLRKYYGHD